MKMVIGQGAIANRFQVYALQSTYIIYAGFIHDSTIQNLEAMYNEESRLDALISQSPIETIVYFSSCSVLDKNESQSLYVKHRIRMENLLEKSKCNYLIIRLPQIIGLGDESTSLINYLVDAIRNNKPFKIWKNAQKNIIDIDDVYSIVQEILNKKTYFNKTINIASPRKTSILDIVQKIEVFFNLKANYELVDRGTDFELNIEETVEIIKKLKIDFGFEYISNALNKYYHHLIKPPLLLSVVVPTYNEEHGIEEFYRRTKKVLKSLEPRFAHEIIFVNDYSLDNTYQKLLLLAESDSKVKLINFSRNFGNQIGITAGIDYSRGDIAIIIDDDLQDPPEVMVNLIALWSSGFKVVYGVRPKRSGVNFFFKLIAKLYYRTISSLSDIEIPNDTGDFRLLDRVVIENLKLMKEENRYYRGMVAWIGYPQIGCFYERDKRYAGTSTFSIKKYINFAFNGLTSFTDKPLYFSSLAGFFITLIGFILILSIIFKKIFDPSFSIPGWPSLMAVIIFFGGIQLISIGIVGIYLSKVFREVKDRPLYIVESTTNIQS